MSQDEVIVISAVQTVCHNAESVTSAMKRRNPFQLADNLRALYLFPSMCNVQCAVYSVQCSMYTVQCAQCIPSRTMYPLCSVCTKI